MDQETIPLWSKPADLLTYPPLQKNLTCDVCVIGAGISGLTTAYLLSKSGKKVVVLDDGSIAGGQTVRTTGHLSNVLDDRFFNLEKFFGKKGARLAAESHKAAIDFIHSLVSEHNIPCDFEWMHAYLFLPPDGDKEVLKKEYAATKQAGLFVKMIKRAPFKSFDTGPAMSFSHQAHFHPIPYVNKLCALIEEQGGSIYCNTHVDCIEKSYVLNTKQKKNIEANHVVVATNSPINSRFFPHLKQASYRTYVIAGKIPDNYVPTGLYYDTLDPYHYIRIAKSKNGDLLIVGGEDHRTGEEKNIKERYDRLESWTRERFPLFGKILYHWSGQVIEPVDGLGFMGRVDDELYIITGDSGNGLTHGTIGALLIHDLIFKKSSPWTKLYDPHRKTVTATPEFLEENLNSIYQYTDWLTKGEKEALKPGSGAVVRKGVKKCARYRDEKGKIHEMSAVCPHLGAIVQWNESEHCWECPAHGSRFNAMGKVIQGPANCDLNKK